jgi:hypothetical protein
MSEYFDHPYPETIAEPTYDLAETLARTAAVAVQTYGPDHIGVWGRSDRSFAAGMLETIYQHDGKIVYAGVKGLPGDAPNTTWHKRPDLEGAKRAWVEVRLPHAEPPTDE